MRKLKKYLLEARLTIGELQFNKDLFINFIKNAIIKAEYEDSIYWDEMKSIIENKNPNIWKIFYTWCESILELQITPEEFYEKIKRIPLDRLNRIIGSGSNGVVLDAGDKVVKLYYSNHIKNCDKPFYEWCSKHKSKVFPKVYRIGKNWVVMEKLEIGTPKLRKFYHMIDHSYVDGISLYDWISSDKPIDRSNFTKEELEVVEWGKLCKEEMNNIKSPYIKWPGDLSLNNIGERNNGDIIFFDI